MTANGRLPMYGPAIRVEWCRPGRACPPASAETGTLCPPPLACTYGGYPAKFSQLSTEDDKDMPTAPEEFIADAQEIFGKRAGEYGDAYLMHERISIIWTAILGVEVQAHQVALCMAGLKMARLSHQPEHWDSWVDMINYAAIGGACATQVD